MFTWKWLSVRFKQLGAWIFGTNLENLVDSLLTLHLIQSN